MADCRAPTSLANLKAGLNLPATGAHALLGRLVTAASLFIETWLDRPLLSQAYVETRDGGGGRVLVPANQPVTAVAALSIDGIALPAAPDAVSPGYSFSATRIVLAGYSFCRGLGNV